MVNFKTNDIRDWTTNNYNTLITLSVNLPGKSHETPQAEEQHHSDVVNNI